MIHRNCNGGSGALRGAGPRVVQDERPLGAVHHQGISAVVAKRTDKAQVGRRVGRLGLFHNLIEFLNRVTNIHTQLTSANLHRQMANAKNIPFGKAVFVKIVVK